MQGFLDFLVLVDGSVHRFDECRDVNHDKYEACGYENGVDDEVFDVTCTMCGFRHSHVTQQCCESDEK